jgi:Transglycosylase SLT domain
MATIDPNLYEDAGSTWNIDPALLRAVAKVESNENTDAVGPPTPYGTAKGPMQFIDSTGRAYGVANPHNPVESVFGAAHYLSDLLDQNKGNLTAALQTYNGSSNDPNATYAKSVLARYDPSWRADNSGAAPPQTTAAASPPAAKPVAAAAAPTSGPTAGMSTDDIINGLTAPAPSEPPPSAAPTRATAPPPAAIPTTGPTAGMSTDDIISGLAPPPAVRPPPAAAVPPPVSAPAATPAATAVPPGPVAPPIYTAPTTPLIRPGGGGAPASFTAYGSSPATATPNIYGSSPQAVPPNALTSGTNPSATTMPAPGVGPVPPAVTPAQINFLTGLGEGAKRAIDVPAELLASGATGVASGFNWLTGNRLSNPFPETLPSGAATRSADLAADAAYQARLGNDPNAAAGFRAAQALAPLAVGGAGVNLLKLGGAAGRFLAGTAAEDVPGILGWVGRRLSGAAGGAVQGGTTTAMTGDPNTPVGERALPGAVVGAGLGSVVLPTLSGVTNWVANRFGSATTPAAQQIIRAMTRDGMTPGQLDSALTELGPNASLADVGGANIRGLAETAANSPGPASQQARQFLNARNEGQTQRLNDAVKTATGATGSAFDTMEALSDARRAAAAPAYDNFYNNTTVTPEQVAQLRPFIADPIGQQALQKGINIARMESVAQGKPFNPADYGVTQADDGTATVLSPTSATPKMLDAVKRGYDQVLEQYRDPTTGRLVLDPTGNAINNMRAAYVQKMRDAFPQYADALDKWAGPSQDMDALSMGRRVLGAGAGRWAMLPTEAQQQALGELLFSQGPGAQNRLLQAITPGGAAAIRTQLQNALTGYPGVYAGINAMAPTQQASMADRLRSPLQSSPPSGG